jgi:hypothetical protein
MPDTNDTELAKLLETMRRELDEAQATIAEQRQAIKVNRTGIKEWQEKYEHLLYKIHHPQAVQPPGQKKLLGYQVAIINVVRPVQGQGPKEVRDVLSANDLLLAQNYKDNQCALIPIFEGDVDNPELVDDQDVEDGDV